MRAIFGDRGKREKSLAHEPWELRSAAMALSATLDRPDIDDVLALDLLCLRQPDGSALDRSAHLDKLQLSVAISTWAVVRKEAELIAYAYMWPLETADWFVGGIAIHPEYRNAPTVAALSHAAGRLLAATGAKSLKSHVLRHNRSSLRLHQRLGFEVELESDTAFALSAPISQVLQRLRT
jgi:RimJ/RimL family protein N-acetyltransferase